MKRVAGALLALLASACSPDLGDAPFTCGDDGACPTGYACQATVCVLDGETLPTSRPARVTWINSAEMYWFEDGGGATLVVNDGFTPAAHGIYSIAVSPGGDVGALVPLVLYGDEFPMSSSVVPIDGDRFAIATIRFPDVDEEMLTMAVLAVPRHPASGAAPATEELFSETEPFLGGSEPAYIGALASGGEAIDVGWTRPSQGGHVELSHVAKSGSIWQKTSASDAPLPDGIPPLSGDVLLWRTDGDDIAVRLGFERYAVARATSKGLGDFDAPSTDVPLYAWSDSTLTLRYGDFDDASDSYAVAFARTDDQGVDVETDGGYALQSDTEPYTGVPYGDGVLVAPISKDPSFPAIGVGYKERGSSMTLAASIPRDASDELYSARAFVSQGVVYVAWTSFHEALMDLWIATAPLTKGVGVQTASAPLRGVSFASTPVRVRRFAIDRSKLARRSR